VKFSVKNIIVSRLCIRWPGASLSKDWLEYRLGLFERTTLPSVKGQTNQRFKWLLCFSPTFFEWMGSALRDRVMSYRSYGNIEIVFVDNERTSYPTDWLVKEVKKRVGDFEFVATTTLDTDDIIRNDYIERVFDDWKGEAPFLVSPHNFYQLLQNGDLADIYYPNHPSLATLIERSTELRTIWQKGHSDLPKIEDVKIRKSPLKWIQVFHPGNMANEIWGNRTPFTPDEKERAELERDYNIDLNQIQEYFKSLSPKITKELDKRRAEYLESRKR